MMSHCITLSSLKLPDSAILPASASRIAGTAGTHPHTRTGWLVEFPHLFLPLLSPFLLLFFLSLPPPRVLSCAFSLSDFSSTEELFSHLSFSPSGMSSQLDSKREKLDQLTSVLGMYLE